MHAARDYYREGEKERGKNPTMYDVKATQSRDVMESRGETPELRKHYK